MSERLHIHFDVVGGIAGDIFIAAMADAFPELKDQVVRNASAVVPEEVGRPQFVEGKSGAIRAVRFGLPEQPRASHKHRHEHLHVVGHGHGHAHDEPHAPSIHEHAHGSHAHSHGAGSYAEIVHLIEAADLAPAVRSHALAILHLLAEVEAHIHQVPLAQVHFHEIAGWDSIMDVVAAGTVIAALEGASWSVSDLPLGGGLVKTQHGLLPVPAPATAQLLKDFSWRNDAVSGERITPTGAAILRHLIDGAAMQAPTGRLMATGIGAGTRELPQLPNILRVMVFEIGAQTEAMVVASISFEVDDMTGEEIQVASDHLRDVAGVIDLTTSQRNGKKGRSAISFHILAQLDRLDDIKRHVFLETSTIGLRWHVEQRDCLLRRPETFAHGGEVLRVKEVDRPGGAVSRKVESDDVAPHSGLEMRRSLKRKAEYDDQ
jgi:pyridinium-3,5-bisthiocarboxylic acid mononucleotide nickel chelatase